MFLSLHRTLPGPHRADVRRQVAVFAAAAAFAVGLAGCSGGDDGRSGTDAAAGAGRRAYGRLQDQVDAVLAAKLDGVGSARLDGAGGRSWLLSGADSGAAVRCRIVDLPAGVAAAELADGLRGPLAAVGADVLWREPLGRGAWRLDVGAPGRPTHTLALVPAGLAAAVRWSATPDDAAWRTLAGGDGPLVALIIDDWGQNLGGPQRAILDLPVPLTVAVLPGLPHSRDVAARATPLLLPGAAGVSEPAVAGDGLRERRLAAGCPVEVCLTPPPAPAGRREVFLHLPMQPLDYPGTNPGPDALLVGMGADEVAARLDRALTSVPGARGVNNHMGSAATADPTLMAALMDGLRRRGLRFVDSLTSPRSVAYRTAREAGVPALRNRLFLDVDHQDEAAIAGELALLIAAARARGQAVGIGHPHPATAAVLARELPRYEAEGVRFVTVSELIALRPDGAHPAPETADAR